MKWDTTYKNLFDVLLAVYFVSWMFFEIMVIGNKFDILMYSEFSGRLVVIIGRLVPTVALYMFMSVWRDVRGPEEFASMVVECYSKARVIAVAVIFALVHAFVCSFAGESKGRTALFLILAIPYAILNSGFAEIAWSGFVFPAIWNRIPFFFACIFNGFLQTMFSLPLWTAVGVREELGEFSHCLLYCSFCAIVLGCVFRLTESVLACVLVRIVLQVAAYYYSDIVFGSPGITLVFLAEGILIYVAAMVFGFGRD
ncbi:MAG: hypothetical protein IKR68_07415 [Lachnospiraceae bacterium]|nr:hypothetical protein [Lachnospiraceae bacterium]